VLEAVVAEQHFEAVRGWIERKHEEPQEWQEAAQLDDVALYLTAAELEELGRDIWSLFDRYLARGERPDLRPEGARPVTVLDLAFPRRTPAEAGGG